MRLTENERRILARLGTRALAPIAERASRCGLKQHTVRNSVRRLGQRSVLQVKPLINFHRIGFIPFNFFFSLNKKASARHFEVLEELLRIPQVIRVEELAGEFEFCVSGCAHSFLDVETFTRRISEQCGVHFFRKAISCSSGEELLSREYLFPTSTDERCSIQTLPARTTLELDELDQSIVDALLTHKYSSCRQLAKSLRIPAETVRIRVKKLEQLEIIAGWSYSIDNSQLGIHSYRVMLTLEHLGANTTSDIRSWCSANKHTVEIRRSIADWDFELRMETEGPEQFVSLIQGWLGHCSDQIGETRVLSVLRSYDGPSQLFDHEEYFQRAVA